MLCSAAFFLFFMADGGSKGVIEEQKVKGRDVYQTYFVASEGNNEFHKCRECSRDMKQNITEVTERIRGQGTS